MYHILGQEQHGNYRSFEPRRLVFCCYRYGFVPVSGWDSDVGWGCTVRSFQMVLGNVMSFHTDKDYLQYIRDIPERHVFALQNIVSQLPDHRQPGEWCSPSDVANAVDHLFVATSQQEALGFDYVVYGERIIDTSHHFPLLLVLSTKIGLKDINHELQCIVSEMLCHPNSAGIVGGKGSSSRYFVGFADGELLYLDPHSLRAWDDTDYTAHSLHSMPLTSMDPMIAACFYFASFSEYTAAKQRFAMLFDAVPTKQEFEKQPSYKCIDEDEFCVIVDDVEDVESDLENA